MSRKPPYRFIDDVTGFKRWSDEALLRWDGCRVTKEGWDPRPEYLVPPNPIDIITVPFARPDTEAVAADPSPAQLNRVPNF